MEVAFWLGVRGAGEENDLEITRMSPVCKQSLKGLTDKDLGTGLAH
jgi:hypothetical protein